MAPNHPKPQTLILNRIEFRGSAQKVAPKPPTTHSPKPFCRPRGQLRVALRLLTLGDRGTRPTGPGIPWGLKGV